MKRYWDKQGAAQTKDQKIMASCIFCACKDNFKALQTINSAHTHVAQRLVNFHMRIFYSMYT